MLWKLFLTFFKIGAFTFGGGYAMISQIREQVVEKHNWITDDELTEIITVAESTPGPIAINMATYVGYKKRGVIGSAFATLGVVLPSFIIILTISFFLEAFMANKYVAYAFTGIRVAVAFLIMRAAAGMFKKMKKKPLPCILFGIIFAVMIAMEIFSVSASPVFFILGGGAVGIIAYAALPGKEER